LNLGTVVNYLSFHFLENVNQPVGRRGMGVHGIVVRQFRQDFTGRLLAEFCTPLVEGENISNDTLDEDFMFIHSD
jgi:hypothetical protein